MIEQWVKLKVSAVWKRIRKAKITLFDLKKKKQKKNLKQFGPGSVEMLTTIMLINGGD